MRWLMSQDFFFQNSIKNKTFLKGGSIFKFYQNSHLIELAARPYHLLNGPLGIFLFFIVVAKDDLSAIIETTLFFANAPVALATRSTGGYAPAAR
jgi:hypothetical protein